ncbi:MAG: Gfo/Idh/MocA family oxidoreductase [Bacteroidia bacterium]|nr:Gfo/Idh/MocA family oxidoreductase [Bacteroidia bacterium]
MKQVVVGMVGANRGAELHVGGYQRVTGIDLRLKTIMARRPEQLEKAKETFGFENLTYSFEELLNDPEINLIDICTPPYAHLDQVKVALKAGKNVVCEKPLAGYCGIAEDQLPIGNTVSKRKMYEKLMQDLEELKDIIEQSDGRFMYAENFVYAPAIQRAAEIISAKKSKVLFMKGEESLKGSSSPVAGEWAKTGGGTLMRVGSHPLTAILWLKEQEAKARGENIRIQSIVADMGRITPTLTEYEHRHIAAHPHDVEDLCTVCLTFTDGSKATVMANDTLLGGSRNYVELYCNDAAINCNLTLSDLMETYFLDEDGLENVTLSEMLPTKKGWNKPFVVDDIIRGYTGEMQDFCECVAYDKDPQANFNLAYNTTKTIYGAYVAAEEGIRFNL